MTDVAVPILMYHAVVTTPGEVTRALSVAPEAFAEQMALLGERGFTPLTTAELAARWRSGRAAAGASRPRHVRRRLRGRAPPRAARARPARLRGLAVRVHGLAAKVSTAPGAPSTPCSTGTRCANSPARASRSAGTATRTRSSTMLGDAGLRCELIRCRDIIADELGTVPVSFAYPYGYSSRRVRRAVRESGFRAGARRRQRPRTARPGAVRPAPRHRAAQHRHRGVRAARRGPRDRPRLRQGPCPHQGVRHGPQSTTGPEGRPLPCLTRPPQPMPTPRPRPERPGRAPAGGRGCPPRAEGREATSCSGTLMP